jgi:hypothetical protein
MSFKSVGVVLFLILSTIVSYFFGGYDGLQPVLFVGGLVLTSIICVWTAFKIKFRDQIVLTVIILAIAFVDEYSHTSARIFTYYDGGTPSLLTVFGWGLFIQSMVSIARVLERRLVTWDDGGWYRMFPVTVSILLLWVSLWYTGYLPVFSLGLLIIYLVFCAVGLWYSLRNSLAWNFSIMIVAIGFGALMEFIGVLEGMWTFRFSEAIPFFMALTWVFRLWMILALSSILGVMVDKQP